jgi:hypothetical protein
MSELETKTEQEIHALDYCEEKNGKLGYTGERRWVSLDSLKVLLAEQRKEAEIDAKKYGVSSFVYQKAQAKLELVVLLEERLK